MSERIVVCFRHRGPIGDADDFPAAADAIVRRAEALGGRVVAWHSATVAVDFSPDAVEDVIELVTADGEAGRRSVVPQRCSVGIAEGELRELVELGGRAALVHGEALERAEALAHVARTREVLLDPGLRAVRNERLLTRGSRLGVMGKERVRGLRLDSRRPWRSEAATSVGQLVEPPWIGAREPLGRAGFELLSGPSGAGGTRALKERVPEVALWLTPVLGEPLGALAHAMARAPEVAGLDPETAASLESLLAGEGLDADSIASALFAWLSGRGRPGVIVIDDAEHVDCDSLDAVAAVCRRGAKVVARVSGTVPTPLAALPAPRTLSLAPLAPAVAAQLARACAADGLADRVAKRWARRGGGLPLAIGEALAEALESGELVESGGTLGPRARLAGRGPALAPEHVIARRLRFVDAPARRILEVLAVLGGSADAGTLAKTLAAVEERPVEAQGLERALAELAERRWLTVERVARIGSATRRAAICALMTEADRARVHRAAARTFAEAARPMAAVTAAVHATLAGDLDGALPLARRGAAACRAAGMSTTAEALVRFTETGDPLALLQRGLFGGASAERAGLQRSDVPPPPSVAPPASLSLRERSESTPRARPSADPSRASDPLLGQVAEPELSSRLALALRQGDTSAQNQIVAELRGDPGQPLLADRVETMVCIARGQIGDALRLARQAKERAAALGAAELSRAALTYAIALGAAGRASDALLEALEGLARAREAVDSQGEKACVRFLAKLSRASGSALAAETWSDLARP